MYVTGDGKRFDTMEQACAHADAVFRARNVVVSVRMLRCDMHADCREPITHVDASGFAYCTRHGEQRQAYERCRKLRPHERRKLQRGESLTRY